MRFIPTRFHGLLDYIIGAALIAAPWIFNFVPEGGYNNWGNETLTPMVLGLILILQSLFTNYEWGVFKYLQMPTHLMMDILLGVFLAVSPWALGFADYVYAPHLIVGICEVVLALTTQRAPQTASPNLMGNDNRYNTMPSRS